jgi:DNA-binding MarR family transcriptional regulator
MGRKLTCNCLPLRQATRRVTQLYDQAFVPLGLRATQWALLVEAKRQGPIAINPLAERLVMDRATLGHNLRPLQARGLVKLQVGRDRRSREIAITAAGRKIVAEGRRLWSRAQRAFEKEIGAATAAGLRNLLQQVAAAEFALLPSARLRK